ncbi:acyl-CoA dehydrogenase family protein [Microbaculum marinisediminis]|uniref:Acyl-CoA/acyl-ACP dehydrogenase n=1 Tax=Microbaculum marinisediminis TaxID=2931392 RepID=A0AAW5R1B4_9HYPH|nr:acyl-CoA dehydrogenase family protein [Microbaculum sp. A6E488]MCT8973773.1 acyl-CoA/acyl-ACP dehydrogenase [Microbaculum sp. A6E488]
MLREAVDSALANVVLTPAEPDPQALSRRHWSLAAEMGWTAADIDEAHGGLGLGLAYIADICESAGRHLFCGPFAETAVLLPSVAREVETLSALLPGVAAGDVRVAYAEASIPDGSGGSVSFAPVEHALQATHLAVIEESGGELRVLITDLDGAEISPLQSMDLSVSVARVVLPDPSRCPPITLGAEATRRVLSAMHIAVGADLLGVGEAALARTVEHVSSRKQFGRPIGAFQALKHRLADVHTALRTARLALAHGVGDGATFQDTRAARTLAADAAMRATATAIQLHGGSGFSWELDLHLFLKRARRLNARTGGTNRLRASAGNDYIERTIAARA